MAHLRISQAWCLQNKRSSLVLLFAAAFMLSSMQAHAQAPTKTNAAAKKKVKFDTRSTKQRLQVTSQKEWTQAPPNFPIPLPPGKFVRGWERVNGLGKFTDLRIESKNNARSVSSWYAAQLKAGGWELSQKMPKRGQRIGTLNGHKYGKVARISVSQASGGGSMVGVSLVENNPVQYETK